MLVIMLVGIQGVLLVSTMVLCILFGDWNVFGIALWITALFVFGAAYASLGKSLTPSPVPNHQGLKTGGIYRFIRHPMYLSLLIYATGGAAITRWAAIPLVGLAALLAYKIAFEERLLSELYPEFNHYQALTKRIIPFLW